MFYYIKGQLAYLDMTTAVLDAGGVGYKCSISQNTYSTLQRNADTAVANDVKLFSYMAVREDGIELFGFYSNEELESFKLLISVSGIGPKAAISILSQLTPAQLCAAICTDDKKAISKANGIGPKTAARVILELKDKFKKSGITADEADSSSDILEISTPTSGKISDARDALMALGYTKAEALSVLKTIDTDTLELDEIIRLALKKIMR